MPIHQGSIVWVTMKDRRGFNKRRPGVVLTADDEILLDGPVVVAAITTTYGDPPPQNVVELPWSRQGITRTGLRRRSAVVCDWLIDAAISDLDDTGHFVPTRYLIEILNRLPPAP